MSNNYYLVARDIKTNDFKMIRSFSTLEQADLYTTKYHNSKELGKRIWKDEIIPTQELDFFLIKERSKKPNKTMDVLYSDSREIRNIALTNEKENIDNIVEHFITKLNTNIGFYSLVKNNINLKSLYEKCIENTDLLKEKDERGNYKEYPLLRHLVESFSKYESLKKSKTKEKETERDRLIIEKEVISKINTNDKQISMDNIIESDFNKRDDYLIETIDMLDTIPTGFTYINEGIVYISNNIYTVNEDLEKLDSLLNQEFGYVLNEYLNTKNELDNTTNISIIEKNKKLIKAQRLKMIEILERDNSVLNNTYKLMKIVSINQSKLLGDNYEYRK